MWFDSHCHLHLCEENAPAAEVIERARSAGVDEMLTVGIDVESSRRSVELASEPGVHASVGLHPNSATAWSDSIESELAAMLERPEVVAVGETGLDFYRDAAPPELQHTAFAAHIDLAKRYEKALVIHTRASIDEAIEVLAVEVAPDRVVFHCWSGDENQMRRALDLGAYISFAGNVSFKSAEDLRAVARAVPHDRFLVETDSPFLSPVPHRGKPNEPRQVTFVGVAVAQARAVSVHMLAEQATQNARALFL